MYPLIFSSPLLIQQHLCGATKRKIKPLWHHLSYFDKPNYEIYYRRLDVNNQFSTTYEYGVETSDSGYFPQTPTRSSLTQNYIKHGELVYNPTEYTLIIPNLQSNSLYEIVIIPKVYKDGERPDYDWMKITTYTGM